MLWYEKFKSIVSECEDEVGLWWGAVICVAANWRLGEDDVAAKSIVEEKFPFQKFPQLNDSHNDNKPLQHAALCIIQGITSRSRQSLIKFVDQAGKLLEQSMVYYHCQQRSSQNFLASFKNLRIFSMHILPILSFFVSLKLLKMVFLFLLKNKIVNLFYIT